MNIFITGANGTIGSVLIKQLIPPGHRITALSLDEKDINHIRDFKPLQIIYGNICECAEFSSHLEKIDIVIHLAALVHSPNMSGEAYNKVNFQATKELFELCKEKGVKHFIFASTIGVYGLSKQHKIFSEKDQCQCDSAYAESKYQAEQYIINQAKGKIHYTIFRFATVYGPWDKGNIRRLFAFACKGLFIAPGKAEKSLVNVDNIADVVCKALQNSSVFDNIYNVADRETYTLEAIYRIFSAQIEKKIIFLKIPGIALLPLLFFNFLYKKISGRPLPVIDSLTKLIYNSVVSIQALLADLDPALKNTLHDGVKKYYIS